VSNSGSSSSANAFCHTGAHLSTNSEQTLRPPDAGPPGGGGGGVPPPTRIHTPTLTLVIGQ
jgi:hypothetical protein